MFAPMSGEGVMLNIAAGRYHSMNPVGVRIWELLETPQTPAQLCTQLCNEFDVSEQDCQRAVLDFTGKLIDRGLVHAAP